MPLFALKSLARTYSLEGADADYKTSKRAEQFRFSQKAIYFPAFPGTQYVPYAAVTNVLSKNTAISVKGTCGKQLPMVRLRLYYDGGEFYKDFMFENQKGVDKVLDAIRAFDPTLPIVRDTTPFGS